MGEAMKKVDHLVARAFKGAMAFVLAVGLCPLAPAVAQEGATANEEGGTAAAAADGADVSTDGAVAGATGDVAGSEADGVQPGGVSGDADGKGGRRTGGAVLIVAALGGKIILKYHPCKVKAAYHEFHIMQLAAHRLKQRAAVARALITRPQILLADEPTGALDSKNARALMEKLSGLNTDAGTTILMVTHDCNAASYCKRILFIQDGVLFHELRRDVPDETQQAFYGRILSVMAQLGGGSANVL